MATLPPQEPQRARALDLNLASEEELERLLGIDAAQATAIAAGRDAEGPYLSTLDLVGRDVIAPHVFHRIRDRVEVRATSTAGRETRLGTLSALVEAARGVARRAVAGGRARQAGWPRWLPGRHGYERRHAVILGGALLAAATPILLLFAVLGGGDGAERNAAVTALGGNEVKPATLEATGPDGLPAAMVRTPSGDGVFTDSAVRYIGNSGGRGVSLRDGCDDSARSGAWIEGTEVVIEERGTGECFTWSQVRSAARVSWVRDSYLVDEQSSLPIVTGTTASLPSPGISWAQQFCIQYALAGSYYQVCRTFPPLERALWTPEDLATYGRISTQRLEFFADCYVYRPQIGRPLDRCAFAQLGP